MKTKIALSIFLIFHVLAIFVLPNPDSILYREWQSVFARYGSTLGINTTWRFFSPNPNLSTVEYEVIGMDHEPEVHRYPPSVAAVGSREAYNRLMNYAIYMAAGSRYLEDFLHPTLCKMHPGAAALSYYVISNRFPTIESAQLRASSREDLSVKTRSRAGEFSCDEDSTAHDAEGDE